MTHKIPPDMRPDSLTPARYSDGYGGYHWFASVAHETTPERATEAEAWTDFIRALRAADRATVQIAEPTLGECQAQMRELMAAADAAGLMMVKTYAGTGAYGPRILTRLERFQEDAA